jgi:rhodanese-related sulfurtransferase/rubrerythrin
MDVQEYFKPLPVLSPEKVRQFVNEKDQEQYTLLDVRRPAEYEGGHLPGAQLIPVDELPERLGELDPEKPVITYCASGIRSRAAAAFLLNSDFREVYTLEGGIKAWHGLVAHGAPEAGMAYFSTATRAEELIALAWLLEEGSRKFYSSLSTTLTDEEAASMFRGLAVAEEHHKSSLFRLCQTCSGKESGPGFPDSVFPGGPVGDVMEGGTRVGEALQWAEGREVRDILELSLSLETNAYDLYLKMLRTVKDSNSIRVFRTLADEEKAHLGRLTGLFDKRLS